jgi:hypothetical protein
MRAKAPEKAPKSCEECPHWNQIKDKVRLSRLVAHAVKKLEGKLTASDFKPTLADFLKLMQLEKELGQDDAKEIRVTWMEPELKSDSEK